MPYSKIITPMSNLYGLQRSPIAKHFVHILMTSSNRLSYITGLDGIRAVAVMAVLSRECSLGVRGLPGRDALLYITNWVYIVREIPYFEAFSSNYGL